MDGAIVLNSDVDEILYANTQLIPDYSIKTSETGTRHRTAERVAKQTKAIVIAISQRRNVISVYKGDQKYVVEDISKIFTKANQALQTLEKYKSVLDQAVASLNTLEFNGFVTIYDVALESYLLELGVEGALIKMQLEELMGSTREDRELVLKDYGTQISSSEFKEKLANLTEDELLDLTNIARILGYTGVSENMDMPIKTKGYRLLNKIHRLPRTIIENLVKYFDNFQDILTASIEELDEVEGIGEIRATYIRNGLVKMKQLALLDRHI